MFFMQLLFAIHCICIADSPGVPIRNDAKDLIQIDLLKFRDPTREDRRKIEEWSLDLESTSMLANRIGVSVTGETYLAAELERGETVNAKRFSFAWVIDNEKDRERLIYRSGSIIDPIVVDPNATRIMLANSSEFDQLRVKDVFHGASGATRYKPSKTKSLNSMLKICGMFFPICGVTSTAISIHSGRAFDKGGCHFDVENLVGIYRKRDHVIAEFEYRPMPEVAYVRVVCFNDGDPVQIDDLIALGVPAVDTKKLGVKRDRKELQKLHKKLKPRARTLSKWSRIGDLHLPTSIHSMTLAGPNAVEVKADFTWSINSQVPDSVFTVESVGHLGPLAILPD